MRSISNVDKKRSIGTMQEKSLHAALKRWYARRGDRLEVRVDGFDIDILRGDLLIEIQTRNFSALKRKLTALTEHHPVRLVYPIAQEKWIVRIAADGRTQLSRRKSPKRGRLAHLFEELVRIPRLMMSPNFSLEVLLIQTEEIRCDDGQGSWRRQRWSIHDRTLIDVVDRTVLQSPSDFRAFLPSTLTEPFTTADLSKALSLSRRLAQKMAYCLREMGVIKIAGKRGRALLYSSMTLKRHATRSTKHAKASS